MFYIKSEAKEPDGTVKVIIHIHSACCKGDYIFIETEPNKFFDMQNMAPATKGQTEAILNARRNNFIWPPK